MAKHMRTDSFADARYQSDFLYNLPEAVSGHAGAAVGNEQQGAGFAFKKQGTASFNILLNEPSGGCGKRNDPFFVALAEDADMAAAQIATVHRQAHQLGNTQTCRIQQIQHGIVSECQRRGGLWKVKQGVHLGDTENLWEATAYFRRFDFGYGVGVECTLVMEKEKKDSECGQSPGV